MAGTGYSPLLMGRKAILFDCDDTLVATAQIRWQVLISTAADLGHQVTEESIRSVWGDPYRQMISRMMPGVDVDLFTGRYREASLSPAPILFAGVKELLSLLRRDGIVLAVITANHGSLVSQDFRSLDILRYFTYIYGCDETAFHKPSPLVFREPLAELATLGIGRQEVLYIGDGWRDFRAAKSAGVDFVAICSGMDDRAMFVSSGLDEDHVFASFEELLVSGN